MGAGNTRKRGSGAQSKVKDFEARLRAAYLFLFLVPVYLWIWECLALSRMVSLILVTVIAAVLIFKVQKIFLEKIEFEKDKNLPFDHQEAIKILLKRWYEFSSASIQQMIRSQLRTKLDDIKPIYLRRLELKYFFLGEEAPQLCIVRVCPVQQYKHWYSIQQDSDQMVIQFVAHAIFPKFSMSLEYEIWLIPFPFSSAMQEVQISGYIKVTVVLSRTLPFPNIVSAKFGFIQECDLDGRYIHQSPRLKLDARSTSGTGIFAILRSIEFGHQEYRNIRDSWQPHQSLSYSSNEQFQSLSHSSIEHHQQ